MQRSQRSLAAQAAAHVQSAAPYGLASAGSAQTASTASTARSRMYCMGPLPGSAVASGLYCLEPPAVLLA
jgi:hypothetical protein